MSIQSPPLLLLCLTLFISTTLYASTNIDQAKDKFVDEMAEKHGFDHKALQQMMAQVEFRQSIINAMNRPAEAKPWRDYRPIFVTNSRAKQGIEFWQANEKLLNAAEEKYGVPPEIIVAIIGVETRYGRNTGSYPILDALATLAFGYPKRAKFFRSELEHYLLLTREENISPTEKKGSYAGAMGKPQFISSSYRSYAIDFDNDGIRDLWDSNADIIGSVANYFKRHGWRRGDPITMAAIGAGKQHQDLFDLGMKPKTEIGKLSARGISSNWTLPTSALSSLILLEGKEGDEYWLGLHNFYVITRYNHSNLYAMAVFQLSQKIIELRHD
ncbi:MAG: lytic murein transglycosylase B [Candidatus Polarisedimenticolaceae bacterium]|nr:lytic murein transglycosylase B [Candidatus Polarisedimenticolaceae bacterium]